MSAVVIGDFFTGVKMSFSLFYIAPVAFVAWRSGLGMGLAFAVICVGARLFTDYLGGKAYDTAFIALWNTGARTGILVFTALVMWRVRLEVRAANLAKDQALAASRVKSEFLWSMSHELRTPLNALLAMAELLAGTRLDEEQGTYVRTFRREGRNLLALIGDLLDSAKIEEGQFSAENIAFSLRGLLSEVESIVGAQAKRKGLGFSLTIAPSVFDGVRGDPLLIKRTLLNLTGNAVKFTSTGLIGLEVGLDAEGRTMFIVRDSGIGMDEETMSHLFEPFSQASTATRREFGGTGLGLSLCKRFVSLMGGAIQVESHPGAGSSFSFAIPLPEAEPEISVSTAVEAEESVQLRHCRILVADDVAINREIVRAFLLKEGWEVEDASDGEAAVALADSGQWDLILMDAQMPKMDGYSATRAIRNRERRAGRVRTPIVALTAQASEEDVRDSEAAGCDAHLTKPFTRKQLVATITSLLPALGSSAAEAASPGRDPDVEALVPLFLKDADRLITQAKAAASVSDWAEVSAIAHKIKGAGGSFGFDRISELGAELEAASQSPDIQRVELVLEWLDAEMRLAATKGK
ncbi:MAG: ATP-binding protein [Spirochaetota bacterium]